MLHSAWAWLSQPGNAALVVGWVIAVSSEALPFTKGRVNGVLHGIIAFMTKAKPVLAAVEPIKPKDGSN